MNASIYLNGSNSKSSLETKEWRVVIIIIIAGNSFLYLNRDCLAGSNRLIPVISNLSKRLIRFGLKASIGRQCQRSQTHISLDSYIGPLGNPIIQGIFSKKSQTHSLGNGNGDPN